MKYATAAYGLAAIEAANDQTSAITIMKTEEEEPEKEGKPSAQPAIPEKKLNKMYNEGTKLERATRKNIAKHTGLREHDIIAMFVKPGGSMFVLRHFLAVDTKQKAIVLAIRGTFSVTGILIDTQAAGGTSLVNRRKIWSGPQVSDASLTRVLVFDSMSKSLVSLCYLCLYRH
jgi:hypothetical protein